MALRQPQSSTYRRAGLLDPVLVGVIFCLGLATVSRSQDGAAVIDRRHPLETWRAGLSSPAGVVYSPRAGLFYVLAAGQAPGSPSVLTLLTPSGDLAGSVRIRACVADPMNMAFDAKRNRLLVLETPTMQLVEIQAGQDGRVGPGSARRSDVRGFGLQDPQGMAVDPSNGRLFILDAAGPRLIRVEPNADHGFERAVAHPVDLRTLGLVRGIAIDPASGHLHVLSPADRKLHELTQQGDLLSSRDLARFGLYDPQGMTFAPTLDNTDDPARTSLYVADRRPVSPALALRLPRHSGRVEQLSLALPMALAATATSQLVATTLTSAFQPPSPDTSGIAYLSDGTLWIADSEVEEMTIYRSVNAWNATLGGSVLRTTDTTRFTKEPTGVTFNPANGHLFYSDDDKRKVLEVAAGSDGVLHTADDVVRSFSTSAYGDTDPEDIAFDTQQGVLYVIDGEGAEVYRVSPGPNGIFNGVPPTGDDVVTHFDTSVLGVTDPEGIAFRADTGHLYISGKPDTQIAEITTAGTLVQTIDISAAHAVKPSGITVAPGSLNPSEIHAYIIQRGIDNDGHPTENDGKWFEMTLPGGGSPTNRPPSVNAGPDLSITLPSSAALHGTATDDGLPLPPTLTIAWTMVSGPAAVTFANPSTADTTATFSTAGTYVLRLTATDGAPLSTYDETTVTVSPTNQPPSVNAGPDLSVTLPNSAALHGTATDDGLPAPPTLTIAWTRVSGPGTVTFASPSAADTTATFSAAGTYVLRLTATDGAPLSSFDETTVTVSATNQPPSVNAGPDLSVTLPNSAALHGAATDDGLPAPPTLTITWTTVSGPGTVSFANPSAADTTAAFSAAGNYVLRLTATDGAPLSSFDETTVIVSDTNQPPSVNAGPDLSVTLPNSAALHGTATDDGMPTPPTLTITWTMVSGPGTVTFGNPGAADTTATFSIGGTYVLRLTASDGVLSGSDDATVVVGTAGQAILSVVKRGTIHNEADASSYSFASLTANNDRLYVLFMSTSIGTGLAPTATGVAGAGLTFTELGTPGGFVYSGSPGVRRMQAWRALVGSGATTGTIVVNLDGISSGMDAVLLEFSGMDASGTNGSGAVVQSAGLKGKGTSLTVTLAPFGSPNNRPAAFFNHRVVEGTTEEPGYTELDDATHAAPSAGAECEWNASAAENTPSASWATSADVAGFAVEVKAGP